MSTVECNLISFHDKQFILPQAIDEAIKDEHELYLKIYQSLESSGWTKFSMIDHPENDIVVACHSISINLNTDDFLKKVHRIIHSCDGEKPKLYSAIVGTQSMKKIDRTVLDTYMRDIFRKIQLPFVYSVNWCDVDTFDVHITFVKNKLKYKETRRSHVKSIAMTDIDDPDERITNMLDAIVNEFNDVVGLPYGVGKIAGVVITNLQSDYVKYIKSEAKNYHDKKYKKI